MAIWLRCADVLSFADVLSSHRTVQDNRAHKVQEKVRP